MVVSFSLSLASNTVSLTRSGAVVATYPAGAFTAEASPADAYSVYLTPGLTTVDWRNCTSPTAATRAAWITAVGLVARPANQVIAGDLAVAGTITGTGNVTVGGNLAVTGTTAATGAVTAASTLGITGAVTASSTLGVTGAAEFADDITMTGSTKELLLSDNNLTISDNVTTIGGGASLNLSTAVISGGTAAQLMAGFSGVGVVIKEIWMASDNANRDVSSVGHVATNSSKAFTVSAFGSEFFLVFCTYSKHVSTAGEAVRYCGMFTRVDDTVTSNIEVAPLTANFPVVSSGDQYSTHSVVAGYAPVRNTAHTFKQYWYGSSDWNALGTRLIYVHLLFTGSQITTQTASAIA